jgi:hypothetical protein
MPKADRMAGAIRFVEHEFPAFKVDRLGLIHNFDTKARHYPGRWLWRRQNR